MRYLAAAALCGTLVLGACSQDMPSAPTESDPEASAALRCITPGFPLKLALAQIVGTRTSTGLYPAARPRPLALALARVAEIAALWTLCKPAQAQAKVAVHTTILLDDYRAGRLVGGTGAATAERVVAHTNTMWQGVGLQAPNLPVSPETGTEFGVGLFTPGQQLVVNTASGNGAVSIPGGGFTEPTLITIVQRSAATNPFDPDDNVFPPFYEIIASNASNTHYLASGNTAIVGFCVDDAVFPAILSMSDPAIAHIAVPEGTNPGGFEILDDASIAGLGLDCGPSSEVGSLFDGGLKGFASAAPRLLRTAAASLFLPTRAEAAAIAVGKTGLGGLARSLSPFGVVDRADGEVGTLSHVDPEFSSEEAGVTITRTVLVATESGAPVANETVTFVTEDGTLGNETSQMIAASNAQGRATMTWNLPAGPGVYTLVASSFTSSVSFTVAGADDGELTPLSCSLEGTIKSLNSATPVDVTFSNGFEEGPSITTFWLDFSGGRVFYNSLNPGQSYVQGTFVTHPWILITPDDPENPDDSETCYGIFLPLSPGEGNFGGTVTINPTF